MQISEDPEDQLMVMAAHRYCLGRRSYIVGSCIRWLRAHWNQLTPNTQSTILRETREAIEQNAAGEITDRQGWSAFLTEHEL